MLEKNTEFKKDIEVSFKKEVAEQLQLNNNAMMERINQRFTSFQSVMLHTIEYLVIQMIPKLPNHQHLKNTSSSTS